MRAVATALGFALLAAALPSPSKKGISMPLITRSWKRLSDDGRSAWIKAQGLHLQDKYEKGTHSKRAAIATVPLTDQLQDVAYYSTVSIGTPPQSFNISLGTGSSDFWVVSSQCNSSCYNFPTRYDPTSSSSFQDTNKTYSITYVGGDVSGTIGLDSVTMSIFTVVPQAFGVIDTLTSGVIFGPEVSGFMGLGWPSLATTQGDPWWYALIILGALPEPLFAFNLARLDDDPNAGNTGPGGSLDLGFLNSDTYTGNINYNNLISESYWLITLDAVTINGVSTSANESAAIDSGTTFILGPTAIVAQTYSAVPQATLGTDGFYVFPCASAPKVSLTFGGTPYPIHPVDFSRPIDSTGQSCFGTIVPFDSSSLPFQWVVGDTFMKNYYTVFRTNPPSVGFGKLTNSSYGGGNSSTSTGTSTGTLTITTTIYSAAYLPSVAASAAPISFSATVIISISSSSSRVSSTRRASPTRSTRKTVPPSTTRNIASPTTPSATQSSGAVVASASHSSILGTLVSVAFSIVVGVLFI